MLLKEIAKGKGEFITDFGREAEAKDTETGEVVFKLPRFAVWGDKGRGKAEVIESGNNLNTLLKKHNLDKSRVKKLPLREEFLEEKVGSRQFTKLITDTAAAIVREAGLELRNQDVSDRAMKTRVEALFSLFQEQVKKELRTGLSRVKTRVGVGKNVAVRGHRETGFKAPF